jgi:hypothetical protein
MIIYGDADMVIPGFWAISSLTDPNFLIELIEIEKVFF